MNPISSMLNPKSRRAAYFAYALLGLAVGCMQVVLAVYGLLEVKWFLALSGVYGFIGTAFGFVAGSNVVTEELDPLAPPEAIETDLAPEDEEFAPVALVNDIDPTDEADETPVPGGYEPKH